MRKLIKSNNFSVSIYTTPVFLFGFLLYSIDIIAALGSEASGLSSIYLIVLAGLAFFYRKHLKLENNLLAFIIFFITWYLISYAIGFQTEYSNYKLQMFLIKFPALLLIPCFLKNNYLTFFKGAFVALTLFLLIVLFKSFALVEVVDTNSRIGIGVLNPIWISRIILEYLLISVLILKLRRQYNILIFFLILPVVYVSGSKGPLISALIVLGFVFFKEVNRKTKMILVVLIAFLIILSVGYVQSLISSNSDSYLVERFLKLSSENSSEDIKSESRTVVWPNTVSKFFQKDIGIVLFGEGVGNFPTFFFGKITDIRFYPHNIILEILVEQGLVFLLIVLFIVYFILKKTRSNFKYLFAYYLLNAMFSGDLILNEFVFFYFSLSIVNNIRKRSRKGTNLNHLHENSLPNN